MTGFAALRFDPALLARYLLPDIGYPVPVDAMDRVLQLGGDLPFSMLLYWLQERSRKNAAAWRDDEQAMDRLATLLDSADTRSTVSVAGDNWWLEIGPVDLDGPIVTIQRDETLVAALSKRADGRLRASVYRPLDGKSAAYLVGLSQAPSPDGGVSMRDNNWEYALDCSAGAGNFYVAQAGEPYLSSWLLGIGRHADGAVDTAWRSKVDVANRRPALVALELGIHWDLHARAWASS